jgi:hypothetical protein
MRVRGNFVGSPTDSAPGDRYLFAHGSALFVLCSGIIAPDDGQPFPAPRTGSSGSGYTLYRIQAGPLFAVTKVTAFPSTAFTFSLDGGDLYGLATEERENWLDWSRNGLQRTSTKVAYRFRLPD